MKIRAHRGSLAEAMTTAQDIEPTLNAVRAFLAEHGERDAATGRVEVTKYGPGIDSRIGWDTHAVMIDGSIAAFTDGPLD